MDLSTFLGQWIVKVAQDGAAVQPKRFLNPALAGKFRDVQARQAQAEGKVSLDQELAFRNKRGSDPAVSSLLSNLQSMKNSKGQNLHLRWPHKIT